MRGKGLWIGIELFPDGIPARETCDACWTWACWPKDPHETTCASLLHSASPGEDLDWAAERIS